MKLINARATCCHVFDVLQKRLTIFIKNLNEQKQMKMACFNIRGIKKKNELNRKCQITAFLNENYNFPGKFKRLQLLSHIRTHIHSLMK